MRELVELVSRVAELERRLASLFRHGTVEDVDAEKQLVRIRMGEPKDGQHFVGPWVPYGQIAGALKVHTPPSKGQQMTMLNPTGDFRQAVAIPLTWSDQNASPSKSPDEHVLTFGNVKITIQKEQVNVKVGDAEVELKSGDGGRVNVVGQNIHTVGHTHLAVDNKDDEAAEKVVLSSGLAESQGKRFQAKAISDGSGGLDAAGGGGDG